MRALDAHRVNMIDIQEAFISEFHTKIIILNATAHTNREVFVLLIYIKISLFINVMYNIFGVDFQT